MSATSNGNGHGNPSTLGAVTRTAARVVDNLPGQFLALVLVNTLYILGLLWFLNAQADRRDRNLSPIIASCLKQVPIEVVERLLDQKPDQKSRPTTDPDAP
jgi:hypothetical protein